MNPEAEKLLSEIVAKSPETLNADEIAFLKARKSYLKASQLEEFASVLKEKVVEEPKKKKK